LPFVACCGVEQADVKRAALPAPIAKPAADPLTKSLRVIFFSSFFSVEFMADFPPYGRI
jgi:hypothetical protein